MAGLTEIIASFVANTPSSDIPQEAIDKAKKGITDTVGVILAGTKSDVIKPLLRYVERSRSLGSTPVLGTGIKTTPETAALVTGTLGHALDYDDEIHLIPGHPSAVLIAALSSAINSKPVDGRSFLDAYIFGIEVGSKIGHGLGQSHPNRGWHATGTIGVFSAVASVAKLLEFDSVTTRHALSIAASTAAGLKRNFGTMTKSLHVGLAARNAITAALLAESGLTAASDTLEAKLGFFSAYGDTESSDPNLTAANLGRPFAVLDPGLSLKKFPCCHGMHRAIDAMLKLRQKHDISKENVDHIVCSVPPGRLRSLIHSRPETGMQAKFSLEYALAVGVLDGNYTLNAFTDEAVMRPEIQALIPRMEKKEDPRCAPTGTGYQGNLGGFVEVLVTTNSNEVLEARVKTPPGSPPHRELSWEEIKEKFRDCAKYGEMDAIRSEKALKLLCDLENIPSAVAFIDLL